MAFDKSKFIDGFKAETREHIQKLSLGILKLEKSPKEKSLLDDMMREAHTIKGSATMMGYKRIAEIAHRMEDGFEAAMGGETVLTKANFDIFLEALDVITALLEDKVTWEGQGLDRPLVEGLCKRIDDILPGRAAPEKPVENEKPAKKPEVPTTDAISSAQHITQNIAEDAIRVDINRLNKLVNVSGELLISKIRLGEVVKTLVKKMDTNSEVKKVCGDVIKDLDGVNNNIDVLTSSMQEEVMKVGMVPIAYLFNTFPRAMRDLANEKGKDIEFQMKGEETYLDKAIIDQMRDPLMHLLRNAVDHGIEPPEERSLKNKPKTGRITLSASTEGSQVMIEISDDGAGIDAKKVRAAALKRGLIDKNIAEDMSEEQLNQILFMPGFSTSEEVSDISGRGVGLDVVSQTLIRLKGTVEIKSKEGAGTSFVMRLPLTLAITESLIIAAGNDLFAIPIDSVVETLRISAEDIKTVEGKEAIAVRGKILPLLRLNDIFGLPRKGIFEKRFSPVVVVQSVEKEICIIVDELIGRQDIINKGIGDPLKRVKYISGATILGNGNVILVLDAHSIIDESEGVVVRKVSIKAAPAEMKGKKKRTILLAEDVLSTAMLEKNILESVGYSVVIARDGKEALEKAHQETFDIVITDVLMPRMDGFELVANLRKDKMYKDVPIVIVTTRESDADKRRGLESGADAYLLKSEFTSDGLLNTLERLIG